MAQLETGVIGKMIIDHKVQMKGKEPEWMQSDRNMIECLRVMAQDEGAYSACYWALWKISAMQNSINNLGEYVDSLEEKLDNDNLPRP